MIFGFTGRKRSGKNTAAEMLAEILGTDASALIAYADPLKAATVGLDPWIPLGDGGWSRLSDVIATHGWEAAKDAYPEVRRTLQRFGTEAVRENIGQDTWIRLMDDRIDDLTSDSLHVLVTDIRFPNEAELIKEWGGTLIRIERDTQQDGESDHVSEAGLDKIPYDYTIDNNGTLDDLRAAMAHLHFEVTRG